MKLQQLANFKSKKVPDRFGTEVSQEGRRLTGVTPRLLKSYPESPARLLPRAKMPRGNKAFMGARTNSSHGI